MLRTLSRSLQRIGRALAGDVPMEPKPVVLFSFDRQQDVDRWHVFTDAYFGGRSQANWRLNQEQSAAEFSGRCSTELEDDADLARAGYCAATSKVTAIGDYFDLDPYTHLVYTVRGDGHTYMANVRVDSFAGGGGDVWQAPFTTRQSAGWTDVRIPMSAFLMTHKGRLVERRLEMPKDRIVSVGVSISALAGSDPREEARSGVRQQPASGGELGTAQAAAAAGASDGGGASGEQPHSAQAGSGGGAAALSTDFRLLLRSIRAEGRAGVEGPPEQ